MKYQNKLRYFIIIFVHQMEIPTGISFVSLRTIPDEEVDVNVDVNDNTIVIIKSSKITVTSPNKDINGEYSEVIVHTDDYDVCHLPNEVVLRTGDITERFINTCKWFAKDRYNEEVINKVDIEEIESLKDHEYSYAHDYKVFKNYWLLCEMFGEAISANIIISYSHCFPEWYRSTWLKALKDDKVDWFKDEENFKQVYNSMNV